jgi:transcriptional regulator with XRE-family HTH domain
MPRLTRTSNPAREAQVIDQHVGRQIRHWRMLAGKSQAQLAERLGLTFQQIQKYENGANRISAGRLLQIADFFGVEVEDFFAGARPEHPAKGARQRD